MAQFLTLPVENLHMVPDALTDQEACFAEPLAAACRIAEQQVCTLGRMHAPALVLPTLRPYAGYCRLSCPTSLHEG